MAVRTALLNWNNITRDTDFSKYIESVSEPWVIEWLEVSATKVWIWKARVPCERTNGETIYALVYNSSEVTISGNGDVYIEVSQTYIDDWELANEDWTGIATIQVWTMPSKNALKLATISNGVVTDERNIIPKVWELNTQIVSIFDELADLDGRVEALEEADAIDHLEESGLVWELYTLNDKLFKQYTPTLADSTLDANIGDVDANTQIHIQRIWTGVASNQLKLKLKMVGASTQDLVVEVRKWVQVTVTPNSEAYWYWDEVVASGSIPYSSISSDYSEITVNLDNAFWWNKWELLDVVLYMATVNASNYYCVACDSTQYSEWFSYVSVNGSTRARSKLMPYCISDGFAQSLLCKTENATIPFSFSYDFAVSEAIGWQESTWNYRWFKNNTYTYDYDDTRKAKLFTSAFSWSCTFKIKASQNVNVCKFWFWPDATDIRSEITPATTETEYTITMNVKAGESIYIYPYIAWAQWASIYVYTSYTYNYTVSGDLIKSSDVMWQALKYNSIWNLGAITIFWMKDNEFYLWETTNTVVTGDVTLWNAVGFINIWGYKIPYYL